MFLVIYLEKLINFMKEKDFKMNSIVVMAQQFQQFQFNQFMVQAGSAYCMTGDRV